MADSSPLTAMRAFSKDALGRRYRLEVAAAVGRLGRKRIHASMVVEALDDPIPLNKVSDELVEYARWGLLERVDDPTKNTVYELQKTVFFQFASKLKDELRQRFST